MRLRTASAARRSERFSANCSRVTRASRHGHSAGCPRWAKSGANGASVKIVPRWSRRSRYGLSWGKAAWATAAVEAGTSPLPVGRSDMELSRSGPKPLQPERRPRLNRSNTFASSILSEARPMFRWLLSLGCSHHSQRLLHRAFLLYVLPILAGLTTWSCRAMPLCLDLQALPHAPHVWRGRCNG